MKKERRKKGADVVKGIYAATGGEEEGEEGEGEGGRVVEFVNHFV